MKSFVDPDWPENYAGFVCGCNQPGVATSGLRADPAEVLASRGCMRMRRGRFVLSPQGPVEAPVLLLVAYSAIVYLTVSIYVETDWSDPGVFRALLALIATGASLHYPVSLARHLWRKHRG